MSALIDEYFDYLKYEKSASDSTCASYKRDILNYCKYMDEHNLSIIDNIGNTVVLDYLFTLQKQGRSAATVSRCLASLRSLYRFMFSRRYISADPTEDIKGFKTESGFPLILTVDEVDRLLMQPARGDFKGCRDSAMLELLYATGMRVSELISVKLSDVNLNIGYINCIHHGSNRVIPIYSEARDALRLYLDKWRPSLPQIYDEDAVFLNRSGHMLTRQGVWKIIKRYALQAGIAADITPHTIRHSFAMHLLENGADMQSLQKMLGHTDIASMRIYERIIQNKIGDTYRKAHPRAAR